LGTRQRPDGDVAEPDLVVVVLEQDRPRLRGAKFREGAELAPGDPLLPFLARGVDFEDLLAVEPVLDPGPLRDDPRLVERADGPEHLLALVRGKKVIKGSAAGRGLLGVGVVVVVEDLVLAAVEPLARDGERAVL